MDRIFTDNLRFIDEHGRERIFSGMNVCDKSRFVEMEDYCHNPDTFPFEEFKARGFNMIRLGFTWDKMEPKPENYNEKLISTLNKFMDKCAENDIYVYLDGHQDLYSGGHPGGGDGAPAWATMFDQYKPREPFAVWAEGYFWGKACHRAFDNFWANKEYNGKGLQDYHANMWKYVASKLGDHSALFGFDFLNEPFPGADGGKIFKKLIGSVVKTSIFDKRVKLSEMAKEALGKDKPKALDQFEAEVMAEIVKPCSELVRKFDEEKYSPYLCKMAEAVREVTDNGVLFVDNNYYSNMGIPCCNTPITVNGKREAKQCFGPHAYDLMVDTPAYKYANNSRVGMIFDEHRNTQLRLNVPCLVGEWGSCAEGDGWYPHIRFLQDKFDSYKWSNTYWCYFDNILQEDFIKLLTRPYPKAVTGFINEFKFDYVNNVFTLKFTQDKEFTVPNIVYIPSDAKEILIDGAQATDIEIKKHDGNIGSDVIFSTNVGEHKVEIKL